eukprot:Lankesteria_metandrocarpae@DN177_c0_g1_i1.p1
MWLVLFVVFAVRAPGGGSGDRSRRVRPVMHGFFRNSGDGVFMAERESYYNRPTTIGRDKYYNRTEIGRPPPRFEPNIVGADLETLWKYGIESLTADDTDDTQYYVVMSESNYDGRDVQVGTKAIMKTVSVNYYDRPGLLYVRLRDDKVGLQQDHIYMHGTTVGILKKDLLQLQSAVARGQYQVTVTEVMKVH